MLFFKALMVCLGVEPGVAEWKALTNPPSYGDTLSGYCLVVLSIKTACPPLVRYELRFFQISLTNKQAKFIFVLVKIGTLVTKTNNIDRPLYYFISH